MRLAIATSPTELAELYRFRYTIYVEEMNRKQKYVDHASRTITDPLDETGYNIVALDSKDGVVGCVRVNLSHDGNMDYYGSLMRMEDVGDSHPLGTSLCTRLMVHGALRKSTLAARLAIACFDFGKGRRVQWNFVDCNDHLVPFFTRMGYEFTHRAHHDEYGNVNVMRLNLLDMDHLTAIRSLFVTQIQGRGVPPYGFRATAAQAREKVVA